MLKAKTAIFLRGRILQPDTEFSCEFNYAKKLVAADSAELVVKADHKKESLDLLLEDLTIPKLKKLAEENGVKIDSDNKKPDIIKKLVEANVMLNETNI